MTILIQGTNQEIFDRVVEHLAEQKGPALDIHGDCVYRTEDGLSCAVGCLISDKDYKSSYEGESSESLRKLGYLIFRGVDPELVSCLQGIHDLSNGIVSLKRDLITLADTYHLNSDSVSLITEWNVPHD